ncbi:TlpA disulfide reductase family protein [Noviherbaspirillum agri]
MKHVTGAVLWLVLMLCSSIAAADGAIRSFEPDGMAGIVASQKGQPFVLLVWSLDCEFCTASMKNLAQERRKRKGLNIVTLSTDSVEDPEALALMKKRLASVGLTANAWAFGAAPPEQLRYAIDPKWHGEKPRSYWFKANGERVAYSGLITAATVTKFAGQ